MKTPPVQRLSLCGIQYIVIIYLFLIYLWTANVALNKRSGPQACFTGFPASTRGRVRVQIKSGQLIQPGELHFIMVLSSENLG